MKVFDQIPCLNEEQTLPSVLASIPLAIDGLHEIEEQLERIKEIQYRV